jgi:hypothetical protein
MTHKILEDSGHSKTSLSIIRHEAILTANYGILHNTDFFDTDLHPVGARILAENIQIPPAHYHCIVYCYIFLIFKTSGSPVTLASLLFWSTRRKIYDAKDHIPLHIQWRLFGMRLHNFDYIGEGVIIHKVDVMIPASRTNHLVS